MRGYFFFRPLIVILAFLMLPPEFGNFNFLVPKAQAAIVTTQIVPPNCVQTGGNYIIQLVCSGPVTNGPPTSGFVSNILAFENDSVKQYLALNHLPNADSDVAFVYQYGRTDLRTAIRAWMELRMIDIAYRPAVSWSTIETNAYNWFVERLWQHEKDMYQDAVNDRNSWEGNRCGYKIDPDVASVFGIHYIPCVGTLEFNTAPNKDYFLAAAKKIVYDNILIGPAGSYTAPAHPAAAGHTVFNRVNGELRGAYVLDAPDASQAAPVPAPPASASTPPASQVPPPVTAVLTLTNVELGVLLGSVGACVGLVALTIGISRIPAVALKIQPNLKARENIKARVNRIDAKPKPMEEPEEDSPKATDEQLETQQTENTLESQTEDTLEADPVAAEDGATIAGEEAAEVELETTAELGITLEGEALAEAGFLATGPGIVIGLAILLVTIIVTIVVSEAVAEAALSSLDTLNNDIKNNSPDILAYAQDDTQKTKLQDIWAEITYPDIYSTTTLPSPGPTDPVLFQVADGGTTSESTASLIVPDWNYANWSPTLYGGWIIRSGSRTIPDLVPVPVGQSRLVSYNSISPYMRYWGWDGLEYEASRFGTNWVITKGQPQDNDVVCPALASTGVTSLPSPNNCRTWVAPSIQVADVNARHVTLFAGFPPVFTTPSTSADLSTLTGTYDLPLTATGIPAPTFSIAGSLPPGFQLVNSSAPAPAGTANASLRFSGAQAVDGSYSATVNATNGAGTSSETLNLNVQGPTLSTPIVFLSPVPEGTGLPVSWTAGLPITPLTWRVSAAGNPGDIQFAFPHPEFFPSGLTLTDNHDNTATLSGTPATGSPSFCAAPACQINACYGTTQVCNSSPAGYVNNTPPAAVLENTLSWNFPDGLTTSYTLTTTGGAITPVSIGTPCGLSPWATLTDNGDGTAIMTGHPPDGDSQAFIAQIQVITQGIPPDPNFCADDFSRGIKADPTPLITSPQNATLTVGTFGGFQFTTNVTGGTFTLQSPLPAGLSFQQSNNDIFGTPAPGTGGSYSIYYYEADQNNLNILRRTLTLEITEAPALTLPPVIYFMAGAPNTYYVDPTGYPKLGGMSISLLRSVFGQPLAFPAGVYYSDTQGLTPMNGTGMLHGTPALNTGGMSYFLSFNATNSAGSTGNTNSTLHVLYAGDVTHDDVVDCKDYSLVKASLNAKAGAANYNPAADINGDGIVNVIDLAFVTSHLPAGTKCQ